MTESAIHTVELYEKRVGELSIQLDATEAALAVANDSLRDIPALISQTKGQAHQAGFRRGRHGFGVFVGVNLLEMDPAIGVGYVWRF